MITLLALSLLLSTPSPFSGAVLTFDGVGPARLGMSVSELRRAPGKFRRGDPPDDSCYYPIADPSLNMAIMVRKARIVRIELAGRGHATEAGLFVGEPVERARGLYSGHFHEHEFHTFAPGVTHLDIESPDRGRMLVIETDGRIVTKFIVGTSKAVEYAYGCL